LTLVLAALGLQDEQRRPAANLSDEELIEELQRRKSGRLQWIADGEGRAPRAAVTRRGDSGSTAPLSA
jgi:hypothetical protein